ncbi:unnamed protein product [Prorocentrum cordatum]|uniref:Uncharacterized protein n=1 Tax=Prorocentrum cordatum TaxID=2364126 RepID=A0ABN9V9Y3_9DINO|nr:unnamed protein product [Polarella glacialis]
MSRRSQRSRTHLLTAALFSTGAADPSSTTVTKNPMMSTSTALQENSECLHCPEVLLLGGAVAQQGADSHGDPRRQEETRHQKTKREIQGQPPLEDLEGV